MLKGTQALMHAIETGTPEPTNERQKAELATHTPGPWKHEAQNGYALKCFIMTADFDEDAGTGAVIARTSDNIPEADAALLAAAPELLEACRTTLETLQWALSTRPANGSTDPRVMACVDLQETLEAAIAKAGGGK